jgi:hypothetical protein
LLIASADVPGDLVEAMWHDCESVIRQSVMIKPGDRTTIVARADRTGRQYILKRSNLKGLHLLLRSRGRWGWRNAARLEAGGVATPRNLALLEERFGPLRLRSYLLSEVAPGEPLLDWTRARAASDPDLARVADAFAVLWNRLGELRLAHRDMKASNFIVDQKNRIWLVDLDGMRRLPRGPLLALARRGDRARFLRNWQDRPEVEALFRARIDTGGQRGG